MNKTAGFAALGLALAACSPSAPGNDAGAAPSNDQLAAETAIPEPATVIADNGEDGAKSILRPEIAVPDEAPEVPVLSPFDVTVAFGASGMALDDAGRGVLDAMLARPSFRIGGPITVRGHTDSRGDDGTNLRASRKRAAVVRDYLVEKGVAADRITVIGLGETRPIAPNAKLDGSDDPEGRARNRRVDVSVALPPAPAGPTAPSPEPSATPEG